MTKTDLITDSQTLVSAKTKYGYDIQTYDDSWGKLFVLRHSLGLYGIIRAQTWETAYEIAEDEFFPEADETIDELVKEYGYRREHKKVIKSAVSIPEDIRPKELGAYEKFVEPSDYVNGRLPEGLFVRWVIVETPDLAAWTENELFQEAYGFRPNGPNVRDKLKHGIYVKDLNGERLDELIPELVKELEIELTITDETDE